MGRLRAAGREAGWVRVRAAGREELGKVSEQGGRDGVWREEWVRVRAAGREESSSMRVAGREARGRGTE